MAKRNCMSEEKEYTLVDLGLSALWADRNVGATSPTDAGVENHYRCEEFEKTIQKGIAITMPSTHDWCELLEHCRWEETSEGETEGYRVTDPNGNSIFLPVGNYWTGSTSNIDLPNFSYADDDDDVIFRNYTVTVGHLHTDGKTVHVQCLKFARNEHDSHLCFRPVRVLLSRRPLNVKGDPMYPPRPLKEKQPISDLMRSGVAAELDDKANPAYWYYMYDERYCGPSREAYMEKMALQYRQSQADTGVKQEQTEQTTVDYDREQRMAEQQGLHTTFSQGVGGPNFHSVKDKSGRVVISNKDYRFVGGFRNGLAVAVKRKTGKCGYIDRHGREVIPCIWRSAGVFSEHLAGVVDDNRKCGYIDTTGQLVIPCQWKEVWPFHDGLAVVMDFNKRLGFIDRSGRVVVPCRWRKVNYFHDGLAKVSEKRSFFRDKWVYIDRQGQVVKTAE